MRYCLFLFALLAAQFLHGQTLKVSKIAPNVFVHTSSKILGQAPFPSNGLIIVAEKSVILIDTPWDIPQTEQLIQWVADSIKKPITHCIVTHWHDDRSAGIGVLRKTYNTKIAAGGQTARKLVELGHDNPEIILKSEDELTSGTRKVTTFYPGAGHTRDNIVVWLEDERILFGGCFVKSVDSPTLGNIGDADLEAWPQSIKRTKKKFKNPAFIVPGHQSWTSLASLDHTLNLLKKK